MNRVVLATDNAGKIAEMNAILADLGWSVVPQGSLGVATPEETEASFAGNALLKARHAARLTGLAALADDSGLEVDALDGAPGVHSARYAGPQASEADNNQKLLVALASVPAPRLARYRCVIAFVSAADDPEPILAEGVWNGRIASAPRGSAGFGYDPLFEPDDVAAGLTAAMLSAAEKNTRSHRARALSRLHALLGHGALG